MKKLNFFKFLCLLWVLFVVGCSKPNEPFNANEIFYQSQWNGVYQQTTSEKFPIIISFTSDKQGDCFGEIPGSNSKHNYFTYSVLDKILVFNNLGSLDGEWWITDLSNSGCILIKNPNIEAVKEVITLKRIN